MTQDSPTAGRNASDSSDGATGASTRRPRTVGRPRRTGTGSAGADPRQEILDAAARLFADRGVGATTMTEVARAVGLGQSSVYYWFRSKDDLLRGLAGANRESLEVARRLSGRTSPPVHLYAVLYTDVVQMCRGALDFYDLERVAHAQPESFAEILADYGRLRTEIEAIVAAGMAAGDLVPGDARVATVACLAQTEGIQHRYRTPAPDDGSGGGPDGEPDDEPDDEKSEEQGDDPGHGPRRPALDGPPAAARLAATTALRALLVDPTTLDDVERRALAELAEV